MYLRALEALERMRADIIITHVLRKLTRPEGKSRAQSYLVASKSGCNQAGRGLSVAAALFSRILQQVHSRLHGGRPVCSMHNS